MCSRSSRRNFWEKEERKKRKKKKTQAAILEDREPCGGQSANADVVRVSGSVKRRLRRAAVDFGQGVLQQLYRGQNLESKRNTYQSATPFKFRLPRHLFTVVLQNSGALFNVKPGLK